MTTERLREVLSSRPRMRVAAIVATWVAIAALTPLKWALKCPALPFLLLSNLMWKLERRMLWDVGSILEERADARIRDDEEEGW